LGISIDGPEHVNDTRRRDHADRGSYQAVIRGIRLASANMNGAPGLLTVIDVNHDPIAIYEHHKSLGVTNVDFLLPDCTRDKPAPGLDPAGAVTLYADWLIKIFDRWFEETPVTCRIRMFEEIVALNIR
jgi:uncharacterized protein